MPTRASPRTPAYVLHRTSGQAVVRLNGRDVYLGKHGSVESKAEYDRVIAEWLANGRHELAADAPPTVTEVALAFWAHAKAYYRKDGRPTSQLHEVRCAIRPLSCTGQRPPANSAHSSSRPYAKR